MIERAPAYSINAKATSSIFIPKIACLLVNNLELKVYGTVDCAYWHLGNTPNLTPPVAIGHDLYQSADWVDFVAGSRFTVPLSQKASIDILGDAGKGGVSPDCQVAGLLGYQIEPKINEEPSALFSVRWFIASTPWAVDIGGKFYVSTLFWRGHPKYWTRGSRSHLTTGNGDRSLITQLRVLG
jgi:hypothetical protein